MPGKHVAPQLSQLTHTQLPTAPPQTNRVPYSASGMTRAYIDIDVIITHVERQEEPAQPSIEQDDLDMLRSSVRHMLARKPTLVDFANMGLLGLLSPESAGGVGWHPVESCVVAQETGRALTSLPWVDTLIAAAALAQTPGQEPLVADLVGGMSTGAIIRSTALAEDPRTGLVSGHALMRSEATPSVAVVLDNPGRGLVIDCARAGVSLTPAASLDTTRAAHSLRFTDMPVQLIGGDGLHRLSDAATLLHCADSLGALAMTGDLVRDHLSNRLAFTRPIASFQVIQHRLADLAVLEAAGAALLSRAAQALACSGTAATPLVSALHCYVATRVTAALDDCIQLAGGIGFTWEYPPHYAMRRAMSNAYAVRPRRVSVARLDRQSWADSAHEDPEFRAHARRAIADNSPFQTREGHRAPLDQAQEATLRSWYRTMYDTRLLGASWPVECGGDPEYHPFRDVIVTEELIRARAPRPIDQVQLASHVLLEFGTNEQKTRYLAKIRSAEHIWCQLFSEPDCGSDLAGIKARAEEQADGSWRLSGQKTWTTDGHWAQMGLALLRTSQGRRRHDGLTAFLLPMDTDGVQVVPKMTMGGAYEFNDVFFDGAALSADKIVGTVGQGWAVAMSGLETERFGVGGNVLLLNALLEDLVDMAEHVEIDGDPAITRSDIRGDLAGLLSDAQAARAYVAHQIDEALAGTDQPADASIAKLLYSETYNRIARYGADFVVEHGPVPESVTAQANRLLDAWLWSRALTISGGSSEVMRNIIAKRRLHLPQ